MERRNTGDLNKYFPLTRREPALRVSFKGAFQRIEGIVECNKEILVGVFVMMFVVSDHVAIRKVKGDRNSVLISR